MLYAYIIASIVTTHLKQLGCYGSLNRIIYIEAYPTPVDVDHASYVCLELCADNVYSANHDRSPTFNEILTQMMRFQLYKC